MGQRRQLGDLQLAIMRVLWERGEAAASDVHKALLEERGLDYVDVPATPRMLRAVSTTATTPQVFIDGEHVGGADELIDRLAHHRLAKAS